MKDCKWFYNRLKSMNVFEICWRVQQKFLQKSEYYNYFTAHKPVVEIEIPKELKNLSPDGDRLGINWDNNTWTLFDQLDLFGVFEYEKYKTYWNAGFQTENEWPLSDFSSDISISQREDIGDIRTNWELNRHYQFVGLAKNYYITKDKKYLDELITLFDDWNNKNLFLHGVQWTSAMEIAIRVVSWSYMYAFIEKSGGPKEFLLKVSNGIKVMVDYILEHRARYSSANNHLIIEMFGVGIAGILFGYQHWINYSIKVLTEELPKQNYEDGVNKEMSLHYQAFIMEAYGIMAMLLKRNGRTIPDIWIEYLSNMSRYVADCCGDYGEVIVFGDNDEGKIVDFVGHIDNYYHYVLQLMGAVLSKKYIEGIVEENIQWLITREELEAYNSYPCYKPGIVSHYKLGGYTLLRSYDRKVLIGFDHAELGFGSIAAHGHADALSIQVYLEGKPVLVDSGTYNYHVPKKIRNEMRSTKAHNTVYVDGVEQAEMQGPFLWGERYEKCETQLQVNKTCVELVAKIRYNNIEHERILNFDLSRNIQIIDNVDCPKGSYAYCVLNLSDRFKNCEKRIIESEHSIINLGNDIKNLITSSEYSINYNRKKLCKKIVVLIKKSNKIRVDLICNSEVIA